ncbi:hypothetical protein BDZ91DRAFT_804864 [Kalaharituber pfeilii]|nr:hypothetical protein BDZ91DRAFT_804864 [Kalaharituber pfeilii]
MDTTGFSREHYYLGKLFTMPDSSGGKRAIAISASHELMVVSAFTILVGGAFMAWWIIIAVTIPMVTPKKARECETVKHVATWAITEPLQAAYIMVKICYHIFAKKFSKPKTTSTTHTGSEDSISMPATQQWSELLTAFVIMLLALAIGMGSIVSGIYLPSKLVIGHVAPVNETMVFTPHIWSPVHMPDLLRVLAVVSSKSVGRAVSSIDSSGAEMEAQLAKHVIVTQVEAEKGPDGEEGYNINYTFQVNSYDMGLQHLHGLSVSITGKCSFEYGWYEGSHLSDRDNQSDRIDVYTLFNTYSNIQVPVRGQQREPLVLFDIRNWNESFSGDPPRIPFAVLPMTQGRPSLSPSGDPWYFTGPSNASSDFISSEVRPGRPPLQCNEERAWNYRGSYLGPDIAFYVYDKRAQTITHIRKTGTHIPDIPLGIWKLLVMSPFGTVGEAFMVQRAGRLESSTRTLVDLMNGTLAFDAASASAYLDVRRMAFASYLIWRNVLRDAALHYVGVKQLNLLDEVRNDMKDQDSGNPLPGTGDFVVPSDNVSTLRLEVVAGIPSVVAFSWITVWVVTFLKRRRCTESCVSMPSTSMEAAVTVVKSQPK